MTSSSHLLEERLSIYFKNPALLQEALTHPSHMTAKKNYERLELLGDAVLNLLVCELLLKLFPDEKEGAIAKRRAVLVSGKTLSAVARQLQLGQYLHLSEGEAREGRDNDSNLENAMEALIGAMYHDQGLDRTRKCIIPLWQPFAESAALPPRDAKTMLQEWAQGKGKKLPLYQLVQHSGPAHAPQFEIEVSVEGEAAISATANSKRAAEQEAAQKLLAKLGINE